MKGEGAVSAEDIQNDSEYACPVIIGTPAVTLTLDFDTGSSDLWVWSTETREKRSDKAKHAVYNPSKSRTSHQIPHVTWKISYADQSSASGDVHTDVVKLGNVTIPNQAVEVARQLSDAFTESGSDGILGLAFHRLNTASTKQKTPMENMIEQKLIKEPIFTVRLDKGDSEGYYTFGYMEMPKKASKLYYTRVIKDNGYWEFRSCYFKFGKQIYHRDNNTAILDTGTTLVLLHDTFVHLIYSAIPGAYLDSDQGGYIFPTNTKIPPLSFCVGDYLFTIPGKDLAFSEAGKGYSFGAVQSRGGNPQDILGDVFLKHIYAVFDQSDPPRLGIAQRP
ncbi:acid protease [Sistotremastrum suecicum HHB10207 ss-3]|uniref:Acid protease n=1 Tax=Sistotremastrum suecicum HHB10207 ss-3 TaxID=1314776 RepID=A0A166EB89_9AGAM|nr:acid protease [Sistotremastrum suecicum HHB10207 ss-3]